MTLSLPLVQETSTRPRRQPEPTTTAGVIARDAFGVRHAETARALMEAVIPGGPTLPKGDAAAADRLARMLGSFDGRSLRHYTKLLGLLDGFAMARHGRRFSALDPERRGALIWSLHSGGDPVRRALFLALTYPVKIAYFDDLGVHQSLGCVWEKPVAAERPPTWMQQVTAARDLPPGETLECDVVVVGTGAGGAVVAKELAEQGVAVLLVEEGDYHQRQDFTRRSMPATQQLYRDAGLTGVIGNAVIPVPLGKSVGGSTTINSGTCFRVPDWILENWRKDLGLLELTAEHLAPYYEKVERTLEVGASSKSARGPVSDVIGEGCDKLGWSHFPVRRNAPDCDGQGVCQWGCPTDAKRSMNVSYVPLALKRGAQLVTGLKVTEVLMERGRAVGVRGRALPDGRRVDVRARAVILACGALLTPVLLLKNGLANHSGQVGRNLSVHPATSVTALFDRPIRGYNHVPQGHGVDQFHREGILMLGASAPLDMGSTLFPFVGRRYVDLMEKYENVASFGVMVEDGPNGRVTLGPGKRPVTLYHLGKHERRLLAKGSAAIARIFRAAGATTCYTEIHGHDQLSSDADIERLERATPAGHDMTMVGFHPLGSCRMGKSASSSVVDTSYETHDVPGLYIVDGSVVPTSLAVNPQLTIMALATRAGELIAKRL
ncbi:MAG: GMC family oxidoreductase [Myxococcales bacterium]|nr:GMC family oxidoreductase [Myxococcales bacterium]